MIERIALLSKEEALARGRERGIDDYIAQMNMFRALLHFPQLAGEINRSIITLVNSTDKVSHRQRELIIMRISWLTDCAYAWSQHWQASLWLGLSEDELASVADWHSADCFDEADKAVLQATDDTLEQGAITTKTWAQLQKQFPAVDEQVAVVACIGNWHMCAQILNNLVVPLEEDKPFWPPTGKPPEKQ